MQNVIIVLTSALDHSTFATLNIDNSNEINQHSENNTFYTRDLMIYG